MSDQTPKIVIQAKLDTAVSTSNINSDLKKIQDNLKPLKVKIDVDSSGVNNSQQATEKIKKSTQDLAAALDIVKNRATGAYGSLVKYLTQNTQVASKFKPQIDEIKTSFASLQGATNLGTAKNSLQMVNSEITALKGNAKTLGVEGKSWFSGFGDQLSKLASFATQAIGVIAVLNQVKTGISNISDMNNVLTTISMTMNTTADQLAGLGNSSIEMADELGTSVSKVMEVASIYANETETIQGILDKATPTVVLSNASGMTGTESADTIQAITNQFEMADDKAMHLADSIEKVSANMKMDFKTGIQSISEAMKDSGSLANSAGLSYEKYMGIIASVAERTRQSGSTISAAMKTTFGRLTRANSGDSSVEEISAADKALQSIGVYVRGADGQFKDLSVTLDALSGKWGDLTKDEKSYVAEQASGTRQKSTFIAMMDGYAKATDLTTVALNSNGFAMQNNEKYVNSIASKTEQFSTTLTKLWTNMISSDEIKGVVDSGTGLITLFTDMNKELGTLPTLAGVATLAFSVMGKNLGAVGSNNGSMTFFGKTASEMKQASAEGQKFGGIFAKEVVQPFANAQPIIDAYNSKLTNGVAINNGYYKSIAKQDEGLSSFLKDAKSAPVTMSEYSNSLEATKVSTVGLSIASTALNMALTMGIAFAIQGIVTGVTSLVNAQQDAIDKANELTSTYKSNVDTINTNTITLQGLESEFNTLSKGVDENGKNVGLTADEYKRYNEIVKEIVGISPSLIKGYDLEGNALIDKNTALQKAIDLQKAKLELDKQTYLNDANTVIKGAQGDISQAKEPLNGTGNPFNIKEYGLNFAQAVGNSSGINFDLTKTIASLKQFGLDYQKIVSGDATELKKVVTMHDEIIGKLQQQGNLNESQKKTIDDTTNLISTQLSKMDIAIQKDVAFVDVWATSDQNSSWYNSISSSGNLDNFNKSIEKFIQDNPTATFEDMQVASQNLGISFSKIQDQIPTDKIAELKKENEAGTLVGKDYNKALIAQVSVIEKLADSYSSSNPKLSEFLRSIAEGYVDFAKTDTTSPIEKITSGINSLSDAYTNVKNQISDMATNVKDLNSVIDEQNKGNLLSGETVLNLIEKYPQLSDAIITTANGYKIKESALQAVKKAEIDAQTQSINLALKDAQNTADSVTSQLASYSTLLGAIKNVADAKAILANEGKQQTDLGISHAHIAGDTTDIDKDIQSYIDASDKIKKLQDQAKALKVGASLVGSNNFEKVDNAGEKAENKSNKSSSENTALKAAEATLAYDKEMGKYTSDNLYKQISLNQAYEKQTENLKKYAKTSDEVYDINEKIYAAQQAVLTSQKAYQQSNLDLSYKELDTRKALGVVQENSASELQNLLEIQKNLNSSAMTLVNTDENRLALQEKIYSVQKAMLETQTSALDDYEKAAESIADKQISNLQKQEDALDKAEKKKSDRADKHIKDLQDEETAIEATYNAQIDVVQAKIDALQNANDETSKQIALEKAQAALESAQNQKSVSIFRASKGFVYEAYQTAITTAKENVASVKLDIQVAELTKQKTALQKSLDDEKAVLEAKIKTWDDYKTELSNNLDEQKERLEEQIQSWNDYKDQWSSIASEYELSQQELYLSQVTGASTEAAILAQRLDVVNTFKDKYLALQKQIASFASNIQASAVKIQTAKEVMATTSATRNTGSISSNGTYTVKNGDTLSEIADYFGVTLAKLKSANGNATSVTVGGKVKIPSYSTGTSFASGGLSLVDDENALKELIIHPNQGRLTRLEMGDGVLNAGLTNNMMALANNASTILSQSVMPNINSNIIIPKSSGDTINHMTITKVELPNVKDSSGIAEAFSELPLYFKQMGSKH